MVNFIALITLVLLISPALANTAWYDPVTKKEIVDVSDKKTKSEIIKEFNVSSQVQTTKLKNCENYRVTNNALGVYDYCKENADKKQAKEENKESKEELIKTKLNLSNKEFKDLEEALGL